MTERIISRNPQLEYYSIKRYRHPAKHSVTRFLFISGFCFSPLVGFVLKALRRESTCAEFVLALPLVIHKSFLAKTRPLHSIMCSILRLNNLWSMSSASEDWLRGKLTVFCRNVLIVKVYVTLQLRFFCILNLYTAIQRRVPNCLVSCTCSEMYSTRLLKRVFFFYCRCLDGYNATVLAYGQVNITLWRAGFVSDLPSLSGL